MTQTQRIPPKLLTQAEDLQAWVNDIAITDADTYADACEALRTFALLRREFERHYAKVKAPLNDARAKIIAMEKEDLERVVPAENVLKTMILAYDDTQQARVREQLAQSPTTAISLPEPPQGIIKPAPTPHVVVTDKMALVRAVASGQLPLSVVEPRIPELNKLARKEGGLFQAPGCAVEYTRTVVVR
jgi:phage FluMu protein gp41